MAQSTVTMNVEVNHAVQDLLWLVDRIIIITESENRQLNEGLPAPEPFLIDEKSRCANLLSMWMGSIANGQIRLGSAKPDFHKSFSEKLSHLQTVLDENARLLTRARDATLLRVEAIMQAVREETTPRSFQYGASGTMQAATRKATPIRLSVSI